jgi:prepilin-type processing-associated H-X9-DG protein
MFEVLCSPGGGFDGSSSWGDRAYYIFNDSGGSTAGTGNGPWGAGGGNLGKCQAFNYPCAADDACYLSGLNHVWHGQVLGFNVLYFDGSVKWWTNNKGIVESDNPNGLLGDASSSNGWIVAPNFWMAVQQH